MPAGRLLIARLLAIASCKSGSELISDATSSNLVEALAICGHVHLPMTLYDTALPNASHAMVTKSL